MSIEIDEPNQVAIFRNILKNINYKNPIMIELGCADAQYYRLFNNYFNNNCTNICLDILPRQLVDAKKNCPNGIMIHGYVGEPVHYMEIKEENYNAQRIYLKDLIKDKKINILHLDIQGSEVYVIHEIKELIDKIEYIFISIHRCYEEVKKNIPDNVEYIFDHPTEGGLGDGLIVVKNKTFNDIKIDEITICLHCGCNQDIVNNQIKALEPLSNKYKLYWNNRIDRFPYAYPSYSRLINHSVATSQTEFIILINDRTFPKLEEAQKIIDLLETGFACVFMYNVGFMGFSKQLIRKIGWWDERYLNGGWEDREWVIKLKKHNLALYESQESDYDYTWKSQLQVADGCTLSGPHWNRKWSFQQDNIIQTMDDEVYEEWDKLIGEPRYDIETTWNTWDKSVLNIMYDKPNSGPSASTIIGNRKIV